MAPSLRRSTSRPASTGGRVPGPGANGLRGAADAIGGNLVRRRWYDELIDDVLLDLSARMNRDELLGLFRLESR